MKDTGYYTSGYVSLSCCMFDIALCALLSALWRIEIECWWWSLTSIRCWVRDGMGVGDHRVARRWKAVMGQQNSYMTLSHAHPNWLWSYNYQQKVTRKKLKSDNMFKLQRIFVFSTTTSNMTRHLEWHCTTLPHFSDFPDSYKTVVGVHEMHSTMHPNYGLTTVYLVWVCVGECCTYVHVCMHV